MNGDDLLASLHDRVFEARAPRALPPPYRSSQWPLGGEIRSEKGTPPGLKAAGSLTKRAEGGDTEAAQKVLHYGRTQPGTLWGVYHKRMTGKASGQREIAGSAQVASGAKKAKEAMPGFHKRVLATAKAAGASKTDARDHAMRVIGAMHSHSSFNKEHPHVARRLAGQ